MGAESENVGNIAVVLVLYHFDRMFTSRITPKKNYSVLFALNQNKIYRPSRASFFQKSWTSGRNDTVIIMMRGVAPTDVLHGSGNCQQGCTIPTKYDGLRTTQNWVSSLEVADRNASLCIYFTSTKQSLWGNFLHFPLFGCTSSEYPLCRSRIWMTAVRVIQGLLHQNKMACGVSIWHGMPSSMAQPPGIPTAWLLIGESARPNIQRIRSPCR